MAARVSKWVGVALLAGWTPPAPGDAVQIQDSPRTHELLRLDCRSDLGRREITLFGNGTLRLRDGAPRDEQMWLQELSGSELEAYVARLSESARAEIDRRPATVEGSWVEVCTFTLALPGRSEERYQFGRYDSLSLDLRRAYAIALELGEAVDRDRPPEGAARLPADYQPLAGDVLRRTDGRHFRIVGFTWDGLGVELAGVEDPLTVYLSRDQLPRQFVDLVRRR